MIQCNHLLCIYYQPEDQTCLLNSISLDDFGMCQSGVPVKFSEKKLAKKRAKLRQEMAALQAETDRLQEREVYPKMDPWKI